MDTATRLQGIEARCEALGWKIQRGKFALDPRRGLGWHKAFAMTQGRIRQFVFSLEDEDVESSLNEAESLLTLHEPGNVVKVRLGGDNRCSWEHCALYGDGGYCDFQDVPGISRPGPLCPGAGDYKLVKVEAPDA